MKSHSKSEVHLLSCEMDMEAVRTRKEGNESVIDVQLNHLMLYCLQKIGFYSYKRQGKS